MPAAGSNAEPSARIQEISSKVDEAKALELVGPVELITLWAVVAIL